jgi:hypothetical protein
MFSTEVKKTQCPHGKYCIMWGCSRLHPDGRIVGYDCIHNKKCKDKSCELHHSIDEKNTPSQILRIKKAATSHPKPYWNRSDYNPKQHKVCTHWVTGTCKYGDEKCFYAHKICEGFRLPPPPAEFC